MASIIDTGLFENLGLSRKLKNAPPYCTYPAALRKIQTIAIKEIKTIKPAIDSVHPDFPAKRPIRIINITIATKRIATLGIAALIILIGSDSGAYTPIICGITTIKEITKETAILYLPALSPSPS